jgi:hypothetical protein
MFREAMKSKNYDRGNQHTGGKGDNVNLANKGNTRAYTLSRLQKDNPEADQLTRSVLCEPRRTPR